MKFGPLRLFDSLINFRSIKDRNMIDNIIDIVIEKISIIILKDFWFIKILSFMPFGFFESLNLFYYL